MEFELSRRAEQQVKMSVREFAKPEISRRHVQWNRDEAQHFPIELQAKASRPVVCWEAFSRNEYGEQDSGYVEYATIMKNSRACGRLGWESLLRRIRRFVQITSTNSALRNRSRSF